MKKIITSLLLMLGSFFCFSQELTQPPSGDNQHSTISQNIGLVKVTIDYNSPNVHGAQGEDRTGHIWGELVHYGFIDQGFGTSKAAPWRAGSNENTTITFSHDVKVGGKDIKSGTYGVFLDVEKEGEWNWIFSNNSTSWGSYTYDAKEDALRVPANAVEAPFTEWLTYGFDDRGPSSATAYLQWEKKRVPFKIEVPNVNELYVAEMRKELRAYTGFNYQNWASAAQFCVLHKVNLNEALTWADAAVSMPFIGVENFNTLQTKSMVLDALGKTAEADASMDKAIKHPTATVQSIHQYGRTLLAAGKKEKALEVFKLNKQLNPKDTFTTYVGLARGYTALGDKKNGIKNWEIVIKNLPADQKGNLKFYEGELAKLKG
ncbi:MAG TPA: DUF2911 domain-containing protein [Chryseolinea sp.]|nr:DUF2911 domain-containing protein [Chryseolinea sp.]